MQRSAGGERAAFDVGCRRRLYGLPFRVGDEGAETGRCSSRRCARLAAQARRWSAFLLTYFEGPAGQDGGRSLGVSVRARERLLCRERLAVENWVRGRVKVRAGGGGRLAHDRLVVAPAIGPTLDAAVPVLLRELTARPKAGVPARMAAAWPPLAAVPDLPGILQITAIAWLAL